MVGPRKIKKVEITEGRFKDIEIPSLPGIDISLTSKQEITYSVKTGEVLESGPANYEIVINTYELTKGIENKELSDEIQEVTKMPFSLYAYRSGSYRYFTTYRTPEEDKEIILKKLINIVTDFAKKAGPLPENYFNEDLEKEFSVELREMVVFPCSVNDEKLFVVALKDYLENKQDFAKLAQISKFNSFLMSDKNADKSLGDVTVSDVKKYFPNFNKRNKFFVIEPKFHNVLKDFVLDKQLQEGYFNQEEQKKAKNIDVKSVEITEPNLFDIHIKYIEEKGVFLFKGKSYFQKPIVIRNTYVLDRGLWGDIAEEHIYAKFANNNDINNDYMYSENNADRLKPLKGGNSKTGWEIPISEIEKLRKIKENFEEEQKFFGREELLIDVPGSVDVKYAWNSGLAVLYDKNDCYLVYSCRQSKKKLPENMNTENLHLISTPKKHKEGDLTYEDENILDNYYVHKTTFYGFKITGKEADYLLSEECKYESQNILRNSINLNSVLSVTKKEYASLNFNEATEIFETKKLHYQMYEDKKLNEHKNILPQVGKKFKKF